ncbi:hypothetical protein G7Z17_g3387 [Cylindrodendrum hubeiense]|uniref:Uncharacterized protein n=1 Tax=Cylindrodendrum hubeiense TaxID=595255 RepID=A0A9P5LI74_9HYPO|nr:hypothetical protein G7Z17_g3387 [Cylindrodendrum hubeiense]
MQATARQATAHAGPYADGPGSRAPGWLRSSSSPPKQRQLHDQRASNQHLNKEPSTTRQGSSPANTGTLSPPISPNLRPAPPRSQPGRRLQPNHQHPRPPSAVTKACGPIDGLRIARSPGWLFRESNARASIHRLHLRGYQNPPSPSAPGPQLYIGTIPVVRRRANRSTQPGSAVRQQEIDPGRLTAPLAACVSTRLAPCLARHGAACRAVCVKFAGLSIDKISSPAPSVPFYSNRLPLRTASSSRPQLSIVTPESLKMGSAPALGALGMTWTAMRAMQFIALVTIIGLTANFISEMVMADYAAPSALIGTLVVSCIATLYIAISYILYWDYMLPLLIATGADALILIACIVVACTVGKPVSYLSCPSFPKNGNTANFINSLFHNVYNSRSNTFQWVDADQASCYQIKAIWGLSIALCVLFAFSAVTSGCLWKRTKGAAPPPKDVENF